MRQLLVTTLVASAAVTPMSAAPVAVDMMHFSPRLFAEAEVEGPHSSNTVPDGDLIQWIVDNNERLERERAEKEAAEKAAAEALRLERVYKHREKRFELRLKQLKSHVDRTWYVFSGSTPAGWDCSGLTMWFYEGLSIQLEHSATAQFLHGERVTDPLPGDLVVWSRDGKRSGHVGIYAGDGQVIHATRPGTQTKISEITGDTSWGQNIYYVRFMDRQP